MRKFILCAVAAICGAQICGAQEPADIKPTSTHKFAQSDSCSLFLDIYLPAEGSQTTVNGKTKPAVLFVFGGGFKEGERDGKSYKEWYRDLTEAGYPVVAIDYRLGLKDSKNAGINKKFIDEADNAIGMAVDDLFTATLWLVENGRKYGIDAYNMVISGSSAGATTVLQAEWEISNESERASVLPFDFNYKGVISYAGAIFSKIGAPKFPNEPCPIMLLHGTADRIVTYNQLWFFNLRWAGSSVIASQLKARGANYRIYRFDGRKHEIANAMTKTLPLFEDFIRYNVMEGQPIIVDALVDNPSIPTPDWAKGDMKDLYK